jgi:hypothetical protein
VIFLSHGLCVQNLFLAPKLFFNYDKIMVKVSICKNDNMKYVISSLLVNKNGLLIAI